MIGTYNRFSKHCYTNAIFNKQTSINITLKTNKITPVLRENVSF